MVITATARTRRAAAGTLPSPSCRPARSTARLRTEAGRSGRRRRPRCARPPSSTNKLRHPTRRSAAHRVLAPCLTPTAGPQRPASPQVVDTPTLLARSCHRRRRRTTLPRTHITDLCRLFSVRRHQTSVPRPNSTRSTTKGRHMLPNARPHRISGRPNSTRLNTKGRHIQPNTRGQRIRSSVRQRQISGRRSNTHRSTSLVTPRSSNRRRRRPRQVERGMRGSGRRPPATRPCRLLRRTCSESSRSPSRRTTKLKRLTLPRAPMSRARPAFR
mmetsp:Transcript_37717/g.116546  ORF Transcript_37717/g.116546 Transcript_37717/m.116546 type:complete len:272 (+) Transcript_37717:646-1461(+)